MSSTATENRPRILLTGSSGQIGRAIFRTLCDGYDVIGLDRIAAPTTQIVADLCDRPVIEKVLGEVDAVIHAAALHAPHVGQFSDDEFERVNVEATRLLAELAIKHGVDRFVFTSTTALYGYAIEPGKCTWIDEGTVPQPRTIYHRTKLAAEAMLEEMAEEAFQARIMRMSRCFPEPANQMAAYRLHRGVDARDVAEAHVLALTNSGPNLQRYIISGKTPFAPDDCETLGVDPRAALSRRAPQLLERMDRLGWQLPAGIDRVYSSDLAEQALGWVSKFGPDEVIRQFAGDSAEVLPPETI